MDRDELIQSITLEEMKSLLTDLGAQQIDEELNKGHIITNTICHNISDGKMKLYYYFEDKYFHCYTACQKNYNIIDLVISNFSLRGVTMSFTDSIKWICKKLGRKFNGNSKPEGFENLIKENKELELMNRFIRKKKIEPELKVYSDKILTLFSNYKHPVFLEDNVSESTMEKFEIKYDPYGHRVIVPHRKWNTGELIGIKTRALNQHEIEAGYKYIPLKLNETQYSYSTYQNLYGLLQNKETIKKLGKVVIFEAEKSVLQCESYYPNNNFSVALSGSNMSKFQVDMLLSLGIRECIIALDKEYETLMGNDFRKYQEKVIRMAKLLNTYCTVSIVCDTSDLLELKDSPSDKGKEVLEVLMKQKQPVLLEE